MRIIIPGCVVMTLMCLTQAPAVGSDYLTVKAGRILDPAGRQVILHGINLGGKHKGSQYMSEHTASDFARMRDWGFNCVRLLIIWAAIEPEPGRIDEDYLRRIDERIAWAKANGLYVLVDMHQDLWGEKCAGGDGAPAWATLDDGRPDYRLGVVWSDGYLVSPMIQTAFDNFWANKAGPEGIGVQDRFARVWQVVARRYAHEPAVIGYDLLNEPFIGSGMLLAQARLNRKLMELFGTNGSSAGAFELSKMLSDPKRRNDLFEKLRDMQAYRSLIEAGEPVFKHFERTKLNPMYQRVANAIRQADPKHILFLEPSVSANQGFASVLQPVLNAEGKPDALQAFAPHAYDIVTDMVDAVPADEARVRFIVQQLDSAAKRMGLPMLIGEWGNFPNRPGQLPAVRSMVRMMEEVLTGNTYWYFDMEIDKHHCFPMLCRPYPTAVAGTIKKCQLDPQTGRFECHWREDRTVREPTKIYVPATWYPQGYEVELSPLSRGHTLDRITANGQNGMLSIPSSGGDGQRRLILRRK